MLIKTKRFEVELQGGGQFLGVGEREYWLERTDDRPDNKLIELYRTEHALEVFTLGHRLICSGGRSGVA